MKIKNLFSVVFSAIILISSGPIPAEENMFPGNAIGGGGSGSSAEIVGVGTDVIQQVPADGVIGTGSADGTASSDSQTTVVFKEPPTLSILSQTRSPAVSESLPYSGSTADWGPPATLSTKIAADDGMYADSSTLNLNQKTHYLYSYSYGFSIPTGATIAGVAFQVKKSPGTGGPFDEWMVDEEVKLAYGAAPISSNKAVGGYWPGWTYTTSTYGSSSDLWGATLTPTIVNAAQFGTLFSSHWEDSSGNAYVEHVQVTVYYIVP